jgi:hypothetical protein
MSESYLRRSMGDVLINRIDYDGVRRNPHICRLFSFLFCKEKKKEYDCQQWSNMEIISDRPNYNHSILCLMLISSHYLVGQLNSVGVFLNMATSRKRPKHLGFFV